MISLLPRSRLPPLGVRLLLLLLVLDCGVGITLLLLPERRAALSPGCCCGVKPPGPCSLGVLGGILAAAGG